MRSGRWLVIAGVSVLVAGCGPSVARGVQLAQPAPEIQGTDVAGHPVRLSAWRGQVVLLNFWATWCPPCVEEMPDLVRVAGQFAGQGLTVLGASADVGDAEHVAAFVRAHHITYPVLLATQEQVDAYGVTVLPTSFLIDRHGIVRHRYLGPRDGKFFSEDIRALLGHDQ